MYEKINEKYEKYLYQFYAKEDIPKMVKDISNGCVELFDSDTCYIYADNCWYVVMEYCSYNSSIHDFSKQLFNQIAHCFWRYTIPIDILNFWPFVLVKDYFYISYEYTYTIPVNGCLSQNKPIYDFIMSRLVLYDLRNE